MITFLYNGKEHVGVMGKDGNITPLPYPSFLQMLEENGWKTVAQRAAESVGTLPLEAVKILAPIPVLKQDMICLGINYMEHAEESARYKKRKTKLW